MAIFNKTETRSVQQTDTRAETTVISNNTKISGSIHSSCPLQIDGTHEGEIEAQNTVTIGRSGVIEGELSATRLTVTGLFHGTADCERVDIRAGGTFRGKVITDNLTIDQDCSFEGESVKKTASIEAAKKAKSQKNRKAESLTSLPDSLHAS